MWVLGAQVTLEMSDEAELDQGMTECEINSLCVFSYKVKGASFSNSCSLL